MATTMRRESQAHSALRKDLNSAGDAIKALKEECTLFDRSVYKNHSQHRRAAFFKHLQKVKRCLRDINVHDVEALFVDGVAILEQLKLQPNEHHIGWKTLGGDLKFKVDSVLRRLVSFSQAAGQTIEAAQRAYKGLAAQFSMTYFMPFALTTNGILARLTVLFKTLLVRAIEAHGGIILLYLNEVTKSNPLRARITATQLAGYRIPSFVTEVASA